MGSARRLPWGKTGHTDHRNPTSQNHSHSNPPETGYSSHNRQEGYTAGSAPCMFRLKAAP